MPDVTSITPTDMTNEEREEFLVLAEQYERRRNRLKVRATAMADGRVPYTSLSYVTGPDGITRKMHPDLVEGYLNLNPGSEVVREGALPVAKEGEVIGATKATVGQMFDENGRQIEDVQPMTTRTFLASDRANRDVLNPAAGTTGGASEEVNTGTGSLTSSAVGETPSTGEGASTQSAPRMQRPQRTTTATTATPTTTTEGNNKPDSEGE